MATLPAPTNAWNGGHAPGGVVVNSGPATLPVPISPTAPPPMSPAPPKPLNPFFGPQPVLYHGAPDTAAPAALPTGSGCSSGRCPMAQPPAGGTTTIIRTDGPLPVLKAGDESGLPSWLSAKWWGLPLWVWIVIAALFLLALRK